MTPSSISAPVEEQARSYPVFMAAGVLSPFNLKRGLFYLLVPLPILGICLHLGQGVLGLVLMPLAFWPFAFRCSLEPDGIRVSWLFVKERVRRDEVTAVELGEDRRRWVIGEREPTLSIERRDKPRVTLRGRADLLTLVAARLTQPA